MTRTEHAERPEHAEHRRPISAPAGRPGTAGPEQSLLALQQQAGNTAVSRLLAVQRHALNPEEEAGS